MTLAFRQKVFSDPLARGFGIGIANALIVLLGSFFFDDGRHEYWPFLMAFGFSFGLLMVDVVDSATYFRTTASRWSKDGLFYSYAIGLAWGVPVALGIAGSHIEQAGMALVWFVASIVFGVWMNWSFTSEPPYAYSQSSDDQSFFDDYRLELLEDEKPSTRVLYYSWPFVALTLLGLMISLPPSDGWQSLYIPMQIVLLLSLSMRLRPRNIWTSPRMFGGMSLIATIGWTYSLSL